MRVSITGGAPDDAENYRFRLTPLDHAPMPETDADFCDIECAGEGAVRFPSIQYNTAGVYQYTISQIGDGDPRVEYDKTVYYVTVTVWNNEESGRLAASVTVRSENGKTDFVTFVNEYDRRLSSYPISVRKVWTDDGRERPGSVTVELISDGAVLDTVVLNAENEWSHTWNGLITDGKEWYVRENPVPRRYVASYSYSDNTAVITNTYTSGLIQTGRRTWPIRVLGGVGAALLIAGLAVRQRKGKDNA